MKCPYCNAWSEVTETRQAFRRRRCANGHLFKTVEVYERPPEQRKGVFPLEYRDKQIYKRYTQGGITMAELAREFGLKTHSQVSRVIKRLGGQNQRNQGQVTRWEKTKNDRQCNTLPEEGNS